MESFALITLGLYIPIAAGLWKCFQKAGKTGWWSIIPIWNIYVIIKISGLSGWWLVGFLIPFVNWIVMFYIHIKFVQKFGKGVAFGIILTILPFIFYPVLGFGNSRYKPDI